MTQLKQKWSITKQFSFDYGHRVWTQKLLHFDLSLTTECACRHLHGHRGELYVSITGHDLNEQGMILDFKNLGFVKKFVDDVIDHKMILDINDPALPALFPLATQKNIRDHGTHKTIKFGGEFLTQLRKKYKTTDTNDLEAVMEIYDGLVLVDFVPTSENLSKWLFEFINDKVQPLGVWVDKVTLFETPKSQSEYYQN